MRLKIPIALLGMLAGSAFLASCANDTAGLSPPGEAGDLRAQTNSCGEEPVSATEIQRFLEYATEQGFAEKIEQARVQHQDVMMALVEHVDELISKHALPGATAGDRHGPVTVFAPPAIEETVEGDRSSLWSDPSCKRVYVVRACFESGNHLRYRFCRENAAFSLLSAEKWTGNEWALLR